MKTQKGPLDSAEVLATDQYAGQAGRYLFDPVTGTRQRIDEDGSPLDAPEAPAQAIQPADAAAEQPREE
ncbi:hypothetical protein K2O51_23345 [Cupriavidus pinatubonensis]|uniref:hypothetical protein n=1 Tax=Cupriavidus pinatubonensis TaxID=248026 RepID=UPI001C736BC9|nr:hypothetical protein [Cupriavidus pinatubonensis]QYY30308.1 hypothetical protein K2O51_23345 [Cupriavidus pinatubonensis]